MKCLDDILIQKYMSNNVNEKEKEEINKHLAKCPYCNDIYETASLYIDENESMEFEAVNKSFAKDIITKISHKINKKETLLKNETKQNLITNFKKIKENVKYAIHNWINQSVILPQSAQIRLAPVAIRSSNSVQPQVYESIIIQKQLHDFIIDICIIKDPYDNNFHILVKSIDSKQGQKGKRLILYKNEKLIASSLLDHEYQYIKKLPKGLYKFIIASNSFNIDISNEKICEQ